MPEGPAERGVEATASAPTPDGARVTRRALDGAEHSGIIELVMAGCRTISPRMSMLYTNDKAHLADTLGREVSHGSAVDVTCAPESPKEKIEPARSLKQAVQQMGLSR